MIDGKDLRIGNTIIAEEGIISVVNSLKYEGDNQTLINGKSEKCFVPMDIDLKYLNKRGFRDTKENDISIINLNEKNDFFLVVKKIENRWFVDCTNNEDNLQNIIPMELKGVHHLENIYKDFTNKDLPSYHE